MSTRYVDEFFKLRCAPDVLAATRKITNGSKEITEAMSIIHAIRPVVLTDKMNYALVDLCSGNSLVPILGAHILPLKHCISVDKRVPKTSWSRVKRFTALGRTDIMKPETMSVDINRILGGERAILTSVHPCGTLAEQVVNIFLNYAEYRHLYIMPCCSGKIDSKRELSIKNMLVYLYSNYNIGTARWNEICSSSYEKWCLHLMLKLFESKQVSVSMHKDRACISEKNNVIIASKE